MMFLVKIAAGAFCAYIFSRPSAPRATAAQRNSSGRTTAEKHNSDGTGRATAVFKAEARNAPPSHFPVTKAHDFMRFRRIDIYYDPNPGSGGHNIGTVIFLLFGAGFLAHQKITAAATHNSAAEEESVPESSEPIPAAAAVTDITFTCEICADEKPLNSFRILACNHWYCSDCIAKYISVQLLENNTTAIRCISAGCDELFEPPYFRSILPEKLFVWWCDALCEASIREEDKYYCLFKDCSAFLIYDSESRKEIIAQAKCPACMRCFCITCKVQWHEGFLCEEFQKLRVDERSNEDLMLMNLAKQNKWKRCPQCKIFVERSEGCLFMKCRCGYAFCYNCGAPLIEHYCTNCKH